MDENLIVSRDVATWLIENGWMCWLGKKNNFGISTFNTKGGNSRCDVLARKDNFVLGIEIKRGDKLQDLLNGFQQTLGYAGEWYSGDITYIIEGLPTQIDAFVLATKYSPQGFLYFHDNEFKTINIGNEYLSNFDVGEKPITFTFVRLLWRNWNKGPIRDFYEQRRIGNKTNGVLPQIAPKVGILVARVKRTSQEISIEPWGYLNNNIFQNFKTMESLQIQE